MLMDFQRQEIVSDLRVPHVNRLKLVFYLITCTQSYPYSTEVSIMQYNPIIIPVITFPSANGA